MSTTLALDLDDTTMGRLRVIGATRQQGTVALVREALADYLERQEGLAEDAERWRVSAESAEPGHDDNVPSAAAGARTVADAGQAAADMVASRLADLRATATNDLPHPDDDTARDAARRAFRALQVQHQR